MAEVDFLLAAAFGAQSARGTINSTIQGLTGTLDETDGMVLGDPESGEGESGISFALARRLREKAVVSGSFTVQPSDFLGVDVDTFSIAIPMKGNGATATPLDAEYQPLAGIDALLEATGWNGANWGSGNGYIYTPASPTVATAKIWIGNETNCVAVVLQDVEGSWELSQEPGSIGIMTFTLSGTHVSSAEVTTPTFTYGTQSSLSAPSVVSVANTWDVARSFTSMTVTGDNQTQEFPRSNTATGVSVEASARSVDIDMTILADDADHDFELQQLAGTTTPTNALTWTVGTAAGAAATINAYTLNFPHPEVRSAQADKSSKLVWTLNLRAVDTTANTEAELIFV